MNENSAGTPDGPDDHQPPTMTNDVSDTVNGTVDQLRSVDTLHITARPALPPVPQMLPPAPSRWPPSRTDLDEVTARSTDGHTVAVLGGPACVGKTMLALHWGQQNRDLFPDGQFYADAGADAVTNTPIGPAEILSRWLQRCGEHRIPDTLDGLTAAWRTWTSERRALVVIDDAQTAAQVRCLLPSGTDSFALVTSRRTLIGLTRDGAATVLVGDAKQRDDPFGLDVRDSPYSPLSRRLVTEELWDEAKLLIPQGKARPQGGGRQRVDDRAVFVAVVYVLSSRCAWRGLPSSFGVAVPTAYRRFVEYTVVNVFPKLRDKFAGTPLEDWTTDLAAFAKVRATQGQS